jgi:hypothetical protein
MTGGDAEAPALTIAAMMIMRIVIVCPTHSADRPEAGTIFENRTQFVLKSTPPVTLPPIDPRWPGTAAGTMDQKAGT